MERCGEERRAVREMPRVGGVGIGRSMGRWKRHLFLLLERLGPCHRMRCLQAFESRALRGGTQSPAHTQELGGGVRGRVVCARQVGAALQRAPPPWSERRGAWTVPLYGSSLRRRDSAGAARLCAASTAAVGV